MDNLILDVPINPVSFGNVSYNFLRALYEKNANIALFPYRDQVSLTSFDKIDEGFHEWLKRGFNYRYKNINNHTRALKLWHIQGSELAVGKNTHLYTFHETSQATDIEKKLLDLHKHVFFSSNYTRDVFKNIGVPSSVVPVGFDKDFYKTGKKYLGDDVIHFGLMGKFENRKHTARILALWKKKFGNDKKYRLTTLIYNKFLKPEENSHFLRTALNNERVWNIQNMQPLKTNSEVNDYINSIDIELSGLSGGEGWNLPAFNATCLGKWCPVSNHTAHKEWATEDNCILLETGGMMPTHDGRFFFHGSDFNQGEFYAFDEERASHGMDEAVKRAKTPNAAGEKLIEKFDYAKSVDSILNTIF